MMNFVFKTRNFALKARNCVLKMMKFAARQKPYILRRYAIRKFPIRKFHQFTAVFVCVYFVTHTFPGAGADDADKEGAAQVHADNRSGGRCGSRSMLFLYCFYTVFVLKNGGFHRRIYEARVAARAPESRPTAGDARAIFDRFSIDFRYVIFDL